MNAKPWDDSGQARRALQSIVADPHYGAAALAQPAVMSNLLKDFLPDEPREAGLLVAAAQADLAGSLRGYITQGLDPATAISLTASSFVSNSSHTPEAGTWVVTELALALGINPYRTVQAAAPPPPPFVQPTAADAPASQVTSPHPIAPAQPAYGAAASPWQQPAVAAPAQPAYGAAASPWQQPVVAAPPTSSSRRPVASAIIGLVGALFVLIACVTPLYTVSGQPSVAVFYGHGNVPGSVNFWFTATPVVALLAAITAGIGLLASGGRPRGRAMFHGMLIVLGIQNVMLFPFYGYVVLGGQHFGAGETLGVLGGLALLLAGIVGMASGGNRGAVAPGAVGTVPPGAFGAAPPGGGG